MTPHSEQKQSGILVYLVSLVCLVYLVSFVFSVHFVYFVDSVYLVYFVIRYHSMVLFKPSSNPTFALNPNSFSAF